MLEHMHIVDLCVELKVEQSKVVLVFLWRLRCSACADSSCKRVVAEDILFKMLSMPGLVRQSPSCHLDASHLHSDFEVLRSGPALATQRRAATEIATNLSSGTEPSFLRLSNNDLQSV